MAIIYKKLQEGEIRQELFLHFIRHQTVVKCWRKENDKWVIKDDPFIDDWSEADYKFLVFCLRNTVATGGLVCAAFYDGVLKGFVSVEPKLFGEITNTLTSQASMYQRICEGKELALHCFEQQKNGQRLTEQKSYTSQPIQPLKVRHSITKWAVQRRLSTIRPM